MDIRLEGISKTYRSGTVALRDITCDIGKGMFGLLGPNGAGKTTLMRILATLIDPSAGRAFVDGLEVGRNKERVRQMLGYLPQTFGLYKRLNAIETLDYVGVLKGITDPRERRAQIQEVLERVNLWDQRRRRIGEYSGGMRQRLGIAQALLGDPKLLIVDEPTAGLDPEERIRFRNLLADMSDDRVVLLSTHIVGDVESSCTDMAVIRKGEIVFRGRPSELAARAKGLVWQVEYGRSAFEGVRSRLTVISSRPSGDRVSARIISRTKPEGADAVSVEPTLEDGYVALMEGM